MENFLEQLKTELDAALSRTKPLRIGGDEVSISDYHKKLLRYKEDLQTFQRTLEGIVNRYLSMPELGGNAEFRSKAIEMAKDTLTRFTKEYLN